MKIMGFFSTKQLEKLADQIRLLSWAQGAILSTALHIHIGWFSGVAIVMLWIFLQCIALYIDWRSQL